MARKPADERKDEILRAALRLADELGPDRLTTNAVAEAVGLTQPAIFRHFPTKTVLWQAVVAVAGAVCTQPRPAVRLSGEGWSLVVVVDRARPVPVAGGQIGRLRQATTAQLVIDAIGEVAPSDHADVT